MARKERYYTNEEEDSRQTFATHFLHVEELSDKINKKQIEATCSGIY